MTGIGDHPKLFFTTGEACAMAGISAHTLRYWEKKAGLVFLRSPRGKRMLRSEDIQRLKGISRLLREGYSLKAVPVRLRESIQMELPLQQSGGDSRRVLKKVRDGLEELLSALGNGMSR